MVLYHCENKLYAFIVYDLCKWPKRLENKKTCSSSPADVLPCSKSPFFSDIRSDISIFPTANKILLTHGMLS